MDHVSSLAELPVLRIAVAVVVGIVFSALIHRYWMRWAPIRMLVRVSSNNPQRLASRIAHSSLPRPEPTAEYVQQLLGNSATSDQVDAAKFLIIDLNRHHARILDHGYQVAVVALALATELKWDVESTRRLIAAAVFHDAGWMGVPASLIDSPGPYSGEAQGSMQRHPAYGSLVVGSLAEVLGSGNLAISHHHEHWDGTGYPSGIAKQAISKEARLLAVADNYVALTSPELGGATCTSAEATAQIAAGSGTQFDPTFVRALLMLSVRRTKATVVGGASAVSLLRILSSSWASTSAGVAVATATAVALTAVAPNSEAAPPPTTSAATTTITIADTIQSTTTAKPATTTTSKQTSTTRTVPISSTTDPTTTQETPTTASTTTTVAVEIVATTAAPTPSTTAPAATTSTAQNRPPSAAADTATALTGQSITIAVLANDSDPEGSLSPESLSIATGPSRGTATRSGTSIAYSAGGSGGTDQFSYQVCDTTGACATAVVQVTITAQLNAADDALSVPSGTPLAIRVTVLSNDVGSIDPATLSVTTPPATGRAKVNSGAIAYTTSSPLTAGQVVVFGYRVCDRSGACDNATATITAT